MDIAAMVLLFYRRAKGNARSYVNRASFELKTGVPNNPGLWLIWEGCCEHMA
jgi:hypothetical protein